MQTKGFGPVTAIAAMLIVLALSTSGCESAEKHMAEAVQQIELLEGDVAELRGLKEQFDELLAALPEGEQRDAVQAQADQVEAALGEAEVLLPELRAAIESADGDVLEAVEGGVATVAPLLPPPWGSVAIGAVGLAIGLIRAGRTRALARRVIQSVDEYIDLDEVDAARISAEQGAEGKRLVDEAEGKVAKLLF